MATVVRREVRKRGFFGWVFLLIFLAFNLFMLAWLVSYWGAIADNVPARSDAEMAGRAIGGTIGSGILFFFWVCGAIITGLLALLTRGRKTIITEDVR